MSLINKLFSPVAASMDADEVKDYMADHPEGTYTLLDVRQPSEYAELHIPGAKLIPLPQLSDSLEELNPVKPTIAYCAAGGRSRVAAQLLQGRGFKEVYNLEGGLAAWEGLDATGPRELHLDMIRGDETPAQMVILGYGMEQSLGDFYRAAMDRAADPEVTGLLAKLAGVEEQHKKKLRELYLQVKPAETDLQLADSAAASGIMEGGFSIEQFLEENEPYLASVTSVLELSIMLEAQALDLYLRFADKSSNELTHEVLLRIADEEKAHLQALGRLLDQKSQPAAGNR
jgi:sulfur-carrier protein adenylyltransferase/sulfurtransferase